MPDDALGFNHRLVFHGGKDNDGNPTGTTVLGQCPQCSAMVRAEQWAQHVDWHRTLAGTHLTLGSTR